MSDQRPEAREAYFSALRELESLHTQCTTKAKFIDNVVCGKEQATFAVIDRCREAALQIRQSAHVFSNLRQALPGSIADASGADEGVRITTLQDEVTTVVARVDKDLREIISWVPAAVNSRATSSTGFSR